MANRYGSSKEKVIVREHVGRKMKDMLGQLREVEERCPCYIEFYMRTGIETTSCLGTIQIHTNELGYDEDIEMVASGYDILRKKKNIMTPSFYQIRHEHEDSYPCFVRGIQVLSNGDAVLLDESNMKLKHFYMKT